MPTTKGGKNMTNEQTEVLDSLTVQQLMTEVAKRIPREDVTKYLKDREDLRKALEHVCTTLITAKVEEPEFFYKYPATPDDFDYYQLYEWMDMMSLYKHLAERWGEQERGSCCIVEWARDNYLIPECKKLLSFLDTI
jgi:hypothetical protein